MYSPSQPNSTPITNTDRVPAVSREQHAALFAIINKSRMLNGWSSKTAQELDPTIRVWAEIFEPYKIPLIYYHRLYAKAFAMRQHRLSRGEIVPNMDATLLVSCWTGGNGLKAEIEREQIEAGRSLTANAASVCQKCFGTGRESFKIDGYAYARKCRHDADLDQPEAGG